MKDIWPSQKDINDTIASAINTEMFVKNYADVFKGDERWRNLPTPSGNTFEWDSTVDVRAQAPVLRRDACRAGAGRPTSAAPECWRCSVIR